VVNYQRDLNTFLKATGEIRSDEFERAAAAWLNSRRETLSANSISRHLCSLKAFAKANNLKLTTLPQYKLPKGLVGDPHPLPEGIEGVKRMIEAADSTDHETLIAFCGLGGLRIAEALSMRASMVNVQEMTLTIVGKGQKTRVVPMSKLLWETIAFSYARSLTSGDALMISHQERAARRAVTAIGKRAGISRPVASHDLRATFATAVLDKTHNVRFVQALLGHSSLNTTQVYLGIDQKQLREAVTL
jgi:site-specific recombinase XerD